MPFEARELFDALADFPDGVNSGIAPLKVPRTQFANATNATVRGTYARTRPAFRKLTLDYGGDAGLQQSVESVLFQGACYYKPDFGLESLMAQMAGRLFQFQISGTTATVFDRSIAADINSATNSIAWLWQSEKWTVVNDGTALPIFFDGNSSRRSGGASSNINTVGVTFTAPAIGSTVAVTFGSTFSGPFNVPLQISIGASSATKYLFQAVGTGSSFSGYGVTLKNLNQTAGTVEAQNSQVTVQTNVVGVLAQAGRTYSNQVRARFESYVLTTPSAFPVGTSVLVPFQGFGSGATGIISAISGNSITVDFGSAGTIHLNGVYQPVGTTITTSSATQSALVALLYSAFTAPAINASSTAYLDRAYTGSLPQTVYINSKQYQITAVASQISSTSVVLLNLNAPTTASLFQAAGIVSTVAELPAGRMGVNGMGRNWMSLTDGRSFIASDIVGGSSGLAAYSFRDASLKITENSYLNGGGTFPVPGQVGAIRAMIFPAKLDASLGQGALLVYTPKTAFSCNAPVERTIWQDVTNPILTESMKDGGAQGQNSTINVNNDVHSRDNIGIRSLTLARQDYNTWGITPISREVQPTLDADDKSLLPFGSAIEFDNRELRTAAPVSSPLGVYHSKLVALNLDPVSSLRGKAPSVYDGIWTGLNVLQLVVGEFDGKDRALAFCVSSDLTKIELWEILPSDGPDSDTTDQGDAAISMDLQSGAVNFGQNDPRKRDLLRLLDGEIFVDSISSDVTFTAYYKPDQWPSWVPWYSWTETFDANSDPGFRPRMGLGEPDPTQADTSIGRPLREAYTYQFRLVVSGQCRFLGARFKAITCPQPDFAPPKP